MSYPKLTSKMNGYLHQILTYVETVIHPAGGKEDLHKARRRNSKPSYVRPLSPDCLNIRANVRTQNAVRRNPAP